MAKRISRFNILKQARLVPEMFRARKRAKTAKEELVTTSAQREFEKKYGFKFNPSQHEGISKYNSAYGKIKRKYRDQYKRVTKRYK